MAARPGWQKMGVAKEAVYNRRESLKTCLVGVGATICFGCLRRGCVCGMILFSCFFVTRHAFFLIFNTFFFLYMLLLCSS